MRRLSTRILDGFNNWFISDAGVWQTFFVCIAVVILEQIFPHIDPDHFLVLYVLTVYSGLTQPALARAGRVSGDRQEQMLARLSALEEQNERLLEHLCAIRANTQPTIENVTTDTEVS